jgi:hypothetical protein
MSNEIPKETVPMQTEKVFCPNCGVKLREGANFCTECGSAIEYIQQFPAAIPVQRPPPRKKFGTRLAGALIISLGFMLIITAGLVFFLTWGWAYMGSVVLASVGGGLMVLGGIVMLIPVKKVYH